MLKKIIFVLIGIIVILLILGLIFRGSAKKVINKITGSPSEDYQMAIVYTKNPTSQLKDLNVHWARLQVRWEQLEPKNDQFNWQDLDNYVKEAQQANIGLSLIIYTGQGWATKCDPSIAPLNTKTHCPPADLSSIWSEEYGYSKTYYHFTNELAKRYQGKINGYIIHNEVNTLRFWHGTPEQYLELRKTAYKAIHEADSGAIVIDNSLASPVWGGAIVNDLLEQGKEQEAVDFYNRYFWRTENFTKVNNRAEILAAVSKRSEGDRAIEFAHKVFTEPTFDWAGFHYYDPENCFLEVISYIKEEMQKNGYQKPIAMTEGGFSDNINSLDDLNIQQKVAEDLVKMQVSGFANGLTMFAWLPVQEGQLKDAADLKGTKLKGLFAQSGSIRPAGTAWAYLNGLITTSAKITNASTGGINIYTINNNGRNTYVVWSNSTKTLTASEIDTDSFSVVDIFGQTKQESVNSFEVGSTPVYLQ